MDAMSILHEHTQTSQIISAINSSMTALDGKNFQNVQELGKYAAGADFFKAGFHFGALNFKEKSEKPPYVHKTETQPIVSISSAGYPFLGQAAVAVINKAWDNYFPEKFNNIDAVPVNTGEGWDFFKTVPAGWPTEESESRKDYDDIVEAQGSSAKVDNDVQQGTRFYQLFELVKADKPVKDLLDEVMVVQFDMRIGTGDNAENKQVRIMCPYYGIFVFGGQTIDVDDENGSKTRKQVPRAAHHVFLQTFGERFRREFDIDGKITYPEGNGNKIEDDLDLIWGKYFDSGSGNDKDDERFYAAVLVRTDALKSEDERKKDQEVKTNTEAVKPDELAEQKEKLAEDVKSGKWTTVKSTIVDASKNGNVELVEYAIDLNIPDIPKTADDAEGLKEDDLTQYKKDAEANQQ